MTVVIINQIDTNTVRFTFNDDSLNVLIRHGDLIEEQCDALVNCTNTRLFPEAGLDTQIHQAMGQFYTDQVIALHRNKNENSCPIGQSRIFIAKYDSTQSGPDYIISTAGPIYNESEKYKAKDSLESCYKTSLTLANIYQVTSIAYPAISCGINGFPPNDAAQIAIDSIRKFSFNIKDVRCILFDRSLFDIFLQEWTSYANEKNGQISGSETVNENTIELPKTIEEKVESSVPPQSSSQNCVLCKEKKLADDQTLLCNKCCELTRHHLFRDILSNLREAGDKSFEDLRKECQSLQRVLALYPLIYNPFHTFDSIRHVRDRVSEHYLQNYCDKMFSNYVPLAVFADGNCLYNSFIELKQPGTADNRSEVTAIEIRARNVIELVLNIDQYKSQYSNLLHLLDDYEKYIRDEMTKNSSYSSVWDLLSLPSVLNIELCCVYPHVNGTEDLHCKFLNKAVFIPLARNHTEANGNSRVQTRTVRNEVKILFTHMDAPLVEIEKNKKVWVSNHFVPLLKKA